MEEKDERRWCVYIHTSPNDKKYIGITSMQPPEKRWRNGTSGYPHNQHFVNAINKYGWENFTHEIVATDLSEEEAMRLECDLIIKYDSINPKYGYNQTSGGEIGKEYNEELRERLSAIIKEKMAQPEIKAKMKELAKNRDYFGENNPNYGNHKLAGKNNPNWGKKASEETRRKISEALSNPSDETRKKMSEKAKARMTDEYKEFLRQINTGRTPNDETKQKMSKAQKERWTDESRMEWGKKFSGENNGMYGKHHSDETKQKLRDMFSGENSCKYGTHPSEETIQKMIKNSPFKNAVIQLNMDGEYITEYISQGDAGRKTGVLQSQICTALQTNGYAGGFLWVRKDEYDQSKKYTYTNKRFKPVTQFDMDGHFIAQYYNAKEAQRQTSVLAQNIGRCCMGKSNSAGGFKWMYLEDYEKLMQ